MRGNQRIPNMTTTTLPRAPLASPASVGLTRVAVDVFEGIMEARETATRYERLSRLTNAELARLGLTRQDIPRVAVNGRAGFRVNVSHRAAPADQRD